MRTYDITAANLGAGDKIKVGRTWRTVTSIAMGSLPGDELAEVTSTVYDEVKRDYIAATVFVPRTTVFKVAIV